MTVFRTIPVSATLISVCKPYAEALEAFVQALASDDQEAIESAWQGAAEAARRYWDRPDAPVLLSERRP